MALSTGKKLVFGLVAAAIALGACFGVLEVALRIGGYGQSARFYRIEEDAQGKRWLRENRSVTAPYFPPELIRRPQPFRIPAEKPPGTYRIFVLGSSAAMGDPEPAFGMARVLEALLGAAYPELRFEIVNAAITAINSHVVRAIAADCADLQPDLFIIYEGNNEVIGPYGPGTVFNPFLQSRAATRLAQTLHATRTGQLLGAAARRLRGGDEALREWGGMRMFLRHEIARDDPRLDVTADNFTENLRAIVAAGRDAGATVFLCTVLTNQKDFAPFVSRPGRGVSQPDCERWARLFEEGKLSADAGDDLAAEEKFRAALAIDDAHAELHFELGRLCLRRNRPEEAKAFFQHALDLDLLRFRTDSRLNETIRSVARQSHGADVELIDLAVEAAKESRHGILGDELLYEHVHLNLQGTYVVARELFERVTHDLIRRKLIADDQRPRDLLTLAEVRRRLAYTTYEQAMIIKELQARFAGPPFTGQSDNAERRRLYEQRDAAARAILARPETKVALAKFYEDALALRPDDWVLQRNTGMAFVALGLAEKARPHLERAAATIPDDPDTLFALASAQKALGKIDAAERTFAALRQLEPRYPGLP